MITETSAVAFRQNLGEMLNRVQYRQDSIVINKDGKPVAALVDARLFERIRRMQARFDALCDRLAQDFAKVPEAEGLAAIDAAVSAVRYELAEQAKAGPAGGAATPDASGTPAETTKAAKAAKPVKSKQAAAGSR